MRSFKANYASPQIRPYIFKKKKDLSPLIMCALQKDTSDRRKVILTTCLKKDEFTYITRKYSAL
jgi:hypothetical protein